MKSADKPRLVKLLLRLQAIFPRDINELTYEAYYESLATYKIDYIEKVVQGILRSGDRFPLPAEIIKDLNAYAWNETIANDMREQNLISSGEAPKKEGLSE